MGKFYIDHLYFCPSFLNAKELAKQFLTFKFVFRYLNVKRTIRPKCYIKKCKEIHGYTHVLTVRYKFDFAGNFCDYGFIDKKTLLKYPALPALLLKIDDKFDRWKFFSDYTAQEDEYMRDPVYYEDFECFYRRELKKLIDKLYLTEIVALPLQTTCGLYVICYQEFNQTYEKFYMAENGGYNFIKSLTPLRKLNTLNFQKTWNWISAQRKYPKEEQHTEVRPLTALSYAINRAPFEQLFYAILGLESVYTNGNRKPTIKEQLKTVLPKVFPHIDAEYIEKLYALRSDFVHGNITFPNYYDYDSFSFEYNYIGYAEEADFLLLRTIQLLVENDACKAYNDGAGGVLFA